MGLLTLSASVPLGNAGEGRGLFCVMGPRPFFIHSYFRADAGTLMFIGEDHAGAVPPGSSELLVSSDRLSFL